MSISMALACLLALQIKHLVADYLFQTTYMVRNKGTYGHPGGLLHSGFHGVLTTAILLLYGVSGAVVVKLIAVECLVHYHIDWGKDRLSRRFAVTPSQVNFWRMHGLDQALHQATYIAIIWWVFG